MLQELKTKGGIDGVFDNRGANFRAEKIAGQAIMTGVDPTSMPGARTGDDMYRVDVGQGDYFSPTGYQPQPLITRRLAQVHRSLGRLHGDYLKYQGSTKPPVFIMDKRIDVAVDEYFQ